MSQPKSSRRRLLAYVATAILLALVAAHFLGTGDAIGVLEKLHGG